MLASPGVITLPKPPHIVLVNDGDSLSTSAGSSDGVTTVQLLALKQIMLSCNYYNIAVADTSLATMNSQFAANVAPKYISTIPFIVNIQAGTIDIAVNSSSAATVFSALQTYVAAVQALGSNAKCIVGTNPVQDDFIQNPTNLAILQTLNANIIANWHVSQANGGLGADALANYWAQPTVGQGNYTTSAFSNYPNIYSTDGSHGTILSKGYFATIEATA